jgi:peroxiredoxin
MKILLKRFVLILLLLIIGLLSYSVLKKNNAKAVIANRIKTIPQFSFTTLNGDAFTQANLKKETPTIFIYFNSECDYCIHEAKSISKQLKLFKNTQLLFVSTEPTAQIKTFAKQYDLLNQPNITFLHDTDYTFSNRFNATSIPYLLIYSKNKTLLKKHKGQLLPKAILSSIEN